MHRGVRIFHTYKDEFSDIPLYFWYSTSSTAGPGSAYEFDVRDIPDYCSRCRSRAESEHQRIIKAAIDVGLLQSDTPVRLDRHG